MPRRRLTETERELWHRVAQTTRRLNPGPPFETGAPETGAGKGTDAMPGSGAQRVKPPFEPDTATPTQHRAALASTTAQQPRVRVDLAAPIGDRLMAEPVRMDRNLHGRMMRGKLQPEARIDLHGMNVAQAHQALTGFILAARARGLRLVLVITGKGRARGHDHAAPMPVRAGVLKHEVPLWLRAAPLGSAVLELRESHRSHGGTGAYYVYLRKNR